MEETCDLYPASAGGFVFTKRAASFATFAAALARVRASEAAAAITASSLVRSDSVDEVALKFA